MFTGIIEDIAKVKMVGENKLTIETGLKEIKPGDSIAINGVCLTVVEIVSEKFSVDVSQETYSKTNLGELHVLKTLENNQIFGPGEDLGITSSSGTSDASPSGTRPVSSDEASFRDPFKIFPSDFLPITVFSLVAPIRR